MPGPRAVTSPELTNLQAGRQAARFYALIDMPPAIFKARVNQNFGGNYDRIAQITFDGVTLGAYTDIEADMTALIGSADGLADRGMARVRKAATSSILYIGETSEIAIQDNDYLTVLSGFEPWAKHARIDAKVIKMDYDITYTDQHGDPDPVPVLGSDVVMEMGSAETVTVHFDASDSWVIGNGALSYAWSFPGALSYTGEGTATPTATYDTPGRYLAYCEVSTATKGFSGIRVVHILGDGHAALELIILDDPTVDVESGGWMSTLTVFGDVSGVRDRAKVYIFSRDYIDLTQTQQGPETDRENIWLIGWIVGETIHLGSDRMATFEIHGENYFLDRLGTLAAGYEDTRFAENGSGPANTWKEFQNLTIQKALWSLVHWRTTLTRMTDVYLPENTIGTAQAPAASGTIWSQIVAMSEATILARAGCDRLGRLWIQVDPQLLPMDERDAIPIVMALSQADVGDLPVIRRRLMGAVSSLELAGNFYSNGNVTTFGALAPGNAPGRFGDEDPVEGLVVSSQADTIEKAGLLYGFKNNPYPEIPMTIPQINRFIDVFPVQQYCTLSVTEADNTRGLSWTNSRIIPRQLLLHYDPVTGGVALDGVFEAESYPGNAVKFVFPGSDDGPPPGGGGGEIEPPPPPPPPPEPIEGSDTDVVCATTAEVRTTGDFDQASPTWTDKTGAIGSDIMDFCLVDNDTAFAITSAAIYKTENLQEGTPTWTAVWIGANDWPAEYDGSPELMRIVSTSGHVYVLVYAGDGSTAGAYLLRSNNGGTTWTVHLIESGIENVYEDYFVDEFLSSGGNYPTGTDNLLWYTTRQRYDSSGDGSVNPRAIGMWSDTAPLNTGEQWTYNPRFEPTNPSNTYIHGYENAGGITVQEGAAAPMINFGFNNGCSVAQRNEILAYIAANYGVINVDYQVTPNTTTGRSMPYDSARVNYGFRLSKSGYDASPSPTSCKVYIIWYYPHLNVPRALAADGGVVYVGLDDKIVVSRDAGLTWETYIADHGANDIIVPGYANVWSRNIIYWSTDGALYWTYGSSSGDVDKGAALLYEANPSRAFYRIVSDPDVGWPLFAISYSNGSTCNLYKISPGSGGITVSQELLVSSVVGGRGLKLYKGISGRRLFYLDSSDIQYSDGDDGETWTQKKGGWSSYSSPLRIEAMTP